MIFRLLFLVCATVLSLGTSPADAAEQPLLTRWLDAQKNIQTWTADVTQTRALKTLSQPLISKGHVWFTAPNRFRWEIGPPAKPIPIPQPQQMLVIYPRLQRPEKSPLNGQAAGQWKDP